MEISLHRVIAEIKNLEAKLSESTGLPIVGVSTKKDGSVGHFSKESFEANSQGHVDSFVANLDRLRKLKAARNSANVNTTVTIKGRTFTIDEAIVQKATAVYLSNFLGSIKHQFVNANNHVNVASAEVEKKIELQVQSIGGSTKKISNEEVEVIRKMMEKSTGKEIAVGKNVESFVKNSMAELEEFLVEVDFVLSEANATTFVEV